MKLVNNTFKRGNILVVKANMKSLAKIIDFPVGEHKVLNIKDNLVQTDLLLNKDNKSLTLKEYKLKGFACMTWFKLKEN